MDNFIQRIDGGKGCSFDGMDKIYNRVLYAANVIFMRTSSVLYHNEYAYLSQKDVTKLRKSYPVTMEKMMHDSILVKSNPKFKDATLMLFDDFHMTLIKGSKQTEVWMQTK